MTTENSSKVVLIEGKGRPLVDIVGEYISYITNGFDLTMSEIADYLGCSYSFVQKHIQSKVRHIKINQVARRGLLEFEEDSEYRTLFTKRRLFDRKDFFERFIPEEATITKPAQRLFLEDLSPAARKSLMEKAHFNEVEAIKFFQVLVKKAPKRRPLDPVKPSEPLGRTRAGMDRSMDDPPGGKPDPEGHMWTARDLRSDHVFSAPAYCNMLSRRIQSRVHIGQGRSCCSARMLRNGTVASFNHSVVKPKFDPTFGTHTVVTNGTGHSPLEIPVSTDHLYNKKWHRFNLSLFSFPQKDVVT